MKDTILVGTDGKPSFRLTNDFISVVLRVDGTITPFQLTPSHPTFDQLHKALSKGNFKRVPALVTLARAIANKTHGKVQFTKGGITFRGHEVPGVISRLAARTLKETGTASAWLQFVENLYKNPEKRSREEVVEFLEKAEEAKYMVPLTDDGCFLAYKAVRDDYRDCHTGTVSNHIGAKPMMPRKAVDPDRRNECSRGYHFCSLGYLKSFGGQKIMAVKVNPKDVVAIPKDYNYSKGRTWTYEVVYEVAEKNDETSNQHAAIMQKAVVPVYKELKELRDKLLAIPAVKRAIRRGKMKLTTINKQNRGQIEALYKRFAKLTVDAPVQSAVLQNTIMDARVASGLTLGQVAKELDITYKAAWALEHSRNPKQSAVDMYLEAIAKLTHGGRGDRAMVGSNSITKKSVVPTEKARAAYASQFNDYGSYIPPDERPTSIAMADDEDEYEEDED